jgi:broad specificity phosphatase PhoE
LFVLTRHGQSELNLTRHVNGDPSVRVRLTPQGQSEAKGLALQLVGIAVDLCVHTRFGRTRETAELALAGRDVPLDLEPLLDDIDVGELEGRTIDDYRAWKRAHTRHDAFPGGESLDDAARRYGDAFERLLERPAQRILVVCHEIPVRYALNAAAGSDDLDGPAHEIGNCIPHLFDEDGMQRAIERIRELAGSTPSPARPRSSPPAPSRRR